MIRIFKPTDNWDNVVTKILPVNKDDYTEENYEEVTKEEYEAYMKAKEEDKLQEEDKPS